MSLLRSVLHRLRALFRRRRVERELAEEVRFHIEMETEQKIRAGMAAEEARRRAVVAFGGVERLKEESRDERGTRLVRQFLAEGAGLMVRSLRALTAVAPGFRADPMAALRVE